MNQIKTLPSMAHTFTISVKGNENGTVFDGTFTYERLTLGGRLKVNKMEAKLREDLLTLDDDVRIYVEMISLLRYGLTEFPEWWQKSNYGLELFDINVITTIWKETKDFETRWDEQISGNKDSEKEKEEK